MNKLFYKKIIFGTLSMLFIFSSFFAVNTKKVEAQWAVADLANTIQNTFTAGSTYSLQLKEYVLDGFVTNILGQIVHQITGSIVTWINNGFEGSPAFLQNPGSFFLDVADQITGDFLAKNGGPLVSLCSPFSIDIRLALAFKYHPRIQQRYACTLGKIIENTKNAVEGASINGFTAGDFKQGGWPAFVSLTTEPQNNPFGAYLTAESELSIRVANAQIGRKEEISSGRGFLSWRDPKCAADVKTHNAEVQKAYEAQTSSYNSTVSNFDNGVPSTSNDGGGYNSVVERINSGGESTILNQRSATDCPIQTPGSVIAGSLDKQLGVPADKLNLADEINEIVDALFAQLVTQVLQAGLGGISGKGAGDSSSYIGQIQAEAQAAGTGQPGQVADMKKTLLQNMDAYIQNATEYKSSKQASLDTLIATKNKYEAVKVCYATKIAGNIPPLSESQRQTAQTKIAQVDAKITSDIGPLAATLLIAAQSADTKLKELVDLKTSITTAATINDLNAPSQKLSLMVQNRTFTNPMEMAAAKEEYSAIVSKVQPMNIEATTLMQECQIFPIHGNNNFGF